MRERAAALFWHGEKVDANHNCFRWYEVWIQPDLFGQWAVWSAWGRIGARYHRQRVYPVRGSLAAVTAAHQLIHRKIRRGYGPHTR